MGIFVLLVGVVLIDMILVGCVCLLLCGVVAVPPTVYTCDEITNSVKCDISWKEVDVTVRGFNVYTIVGTPLTVSDEPIIFVHGGPGNTHDYMLPMQGLACNGGRQVIFYDQMGAGKSYRPRNLTDAPWLLDPLYYVEELGAVANATVEESSNFWVYGHSWGAMLTQLFLINSDLKSRVSAAVLHGGLSDQAFFVEQQNKVLLPELPPFLEQVVQTAIETGNYSTPQYEAFANLDLVLHICKIFPFPDCVEASLVGSNLDILFAMNGPPYQNKGILKDFNTTAQLHTITQPILVLGGEDDAVPLPCQQMIVDNLPNSTPLMVIERGSHITMADAFPQTFQVVDDFVTKHQHNHKQ